MFLSVQAKALLDQGKHAELKSLPLEQLLSAESFNDLNKSRSIESSNSSTQPLSGPKAAQDSALLSTLSDPVVVSSGHIYSRETILRLFAASSQPVCPLSRTPILADSIIALPEITYFIALWKLDQSVKAIESQQNPAKLSIDVACDKIRVSMIGYHEPFTALLGHIFKDKDNAIHKIPCASYAAVDWSFAWYSEKSRSRLELWFPKAEITDLEINRIIDKILAPLNLPNQPVELGGNTITMADIPPRSYVTPIKEMILPGYQRAGECFIAFLKAGIEVRATHLGSANELDDTIERYQTTSAKRTYLGEMRIGSAVVAARADTSHTQTGMSLSAFSAFSPLNSQQSQITHRTPSTGQTRPPSRI